MKKISSTLAANYKYINRPFALVNHLHDRYFDLRGEDPQVIKADVVFHGSVTGILDEILSVTSGEALSALRVISADADGKGVYTDPADNVSARKILGVTIESAPIDTLISFQRNGRHADDSWSWDTDLPIYVSTSGYLTQTPPNSGNIVVVGYAQSPNSIFVNIERPILLA